MTEPRFLNPSPPLDLDRLLALTGARLARPIARALAITGVGSLDWAGPTDLACVEDAADRAALGESDAGAVLLDAADAAGAPAGTAALISDAPGRAFALVVAAIHPDAGRPPAMFGPGVAAGAVVHPQARLEPDATVAPGAVIGPGAAIGRGARIGANAVIGAGVHIGRDSVIGDGAVVRHALIGDRVAIRAGAIVGEPAGARRQAAATGRVIVQDDVEIGPNATVALGRRGDTVLGEGTRVDALARIGPDARIGRCCFIADPIAAGAVIGDHAVADGDRSSPQPSQASGADEHKDPSS